MVTVSVVIPALNEADGIAACLFNVRAACTRVADVEIIVVDNGSVDGTIEIAREYADHCIVLPDASIAALRNEGVRYARGDILAFIDADCLVQPGWCSALLDVLESGACVTGSKCAVGDDASWIERVWFGQVARGRREARYVNSGNLVIRRQDFLRIGGFDTSLETGEDYEFCRRAARLGPIVSDDRVCVVHEGGPRRLREFYRRELWHGLGALSSIRLEPLDRPFLASLAFGLGALLAIPAAAAASIWSLPWWPAAVLALIPVCVVLAAGALRVAGGCGWALLPGLLVLYTVYFAARFHALLRIAARSARAGGSTAHWKST